MDLKLCWRGPVGAGNFPTDPNAVDAINEAGIYLRLKLYQGDRTIAYVGQSGHLMMRFDQHLTRLLSLHQPLRDASGQIVVQHGPENRFWASAPLVVLLLLPSVVPVPPLPATLLLLWPPPAPDFRFFSTASRSHCGNCFFGCCWGGDIYCAPGMRVCMRVHVHS